MASKKKPSPAQIAAREAFAARARSGVFKRKAAATRKNRRLPGWVDAAPRGRGQKSKRRAKKKGLFSDSGFFTTKSGAHRIRKPGRSYGYGGKFGPGSAGGFDPKRLPNPKPKRRVTKPPSPAQLAARAKFVKMVRARAAASKKKNPQKYALVPKGSGLATSHHASRRDALAARKRAKKRGVSGLRAVKTYRNSRGLSSAAPAWTRSKKAKRVNSAAGEARHRASKYYVPPTKGRRKKVVASKKKRMFSGLGKSIVRGLGIAHNPSKRQTRQRKTERARRQRLVYRRQHGAPAKGRFSFNPRGQHLPGLPAKYQRMYEDVLATSGSKRIAAATTRKAFKRQNSRARHVSYFGVGTGLKLRKHPTAQGPWHVRGDKTRKKKRLVKKAGKSLSKLFNPSPASVFSEFRGKDARTSTKSTGHGTGHLTVAQLGHLRELKLSGKKLSFGGNALLCADGRKKLHIGGVRFKASGGEEDMGEVHSVTYRADKPHIESGTFDYVHRFGENGGKRPHLIVDAEGYPFLEGGSYKIDSDGIIN